MSAPMRHLLRRGVAGGRVHLTAAHAYGSEIASWPGLQPRSDAGCVKSCTPLRGTLKLLFVSADCKTCAGVLPLAAVCTQRPRMPGRHAGLLRLRSRRRRWMKATIAGLSQSWSRTRRRGGGSRGTCQWTLATPQLPSAPSLRGSCCCPGLCSPRARRVALVCVKLCACRVALDLLSLTAWFDFG